MFFSSDLIPVISNNFVNPDTIFANNQMSLQDVEIYGFDYDYTLAFYSSHLHTLIFNIARDILIEEHRVTDSRFYIYICNNYEICQYFPCGGDAGGIEITTIKPGYF